MYEEESRLTASVGACEESFWAFLPCEFVSTCRFALPVSSVAYLNHRCRRPPRRFRWTPAQTTPTVSRSSKIGKSYISRG